MLPVHSGPWKAPKMNLAKEDAKWNAYKTVENRLRVPHRQKNGLELAVGESWLDCLNSGYATAV